MDYEAPLVCAGFEQEHDGLAIVVLTEHGGLAIDDLVVDVLENVMDYSGCQTYF